MDGNNLNSVTKCNSKNLMNCYKCKKAINPLRVKALPKTKSCVNCSTTQAVSGFMSWEHKTAPTLNICSAETADYVLAKTKRLGQSPIAGLRMKGH